MTRARDLVREVMAGASPSNVVEKVLGPAGPQPIGFMANVFQFIKNTPGCTVDQVIQNFPSLEPQRDEVPQWISDTLQGREVI